MWPERAGAECEQLLSEEDRVMSGNESPTEPENAAYAGVACGDIELAPASTTPTAGCVPLPAEVDTPLRELQLRTGARHAVASRGCGAASSSSDEADPEGNVSASLSVVSLLRPVSITIGLTVFLVKVMEESHQWTTTRAFAAT